MLRLERSMNEEPARGPGMDVAGPEPRMDAGKGNGGGASLPRPPGAVRFAVATSRTDPARTLAQAADGKLMIDGMPAIDLWLRHFSILDFDSMVDMHRMRGWEVVEDPPVGKPS